MEVHGRQKSHQVIDSPSGLVVMDACRKPGMVPRVGLEPTPLSRPDFESGVATDYTTEADAQELAQGADYHMTKARFVVRCDNEAVLSSFPFPEPLTPCRRTRPSKRPSATRRWCGCSASSAPRSR